MSINVNDKNIGHATAYAYYKAGGGTMTEAEFTEFMADFGTASQTAVEAAQAALASKNAAQTAATTATNKASEASQSASAAHTDAETASQSASQASTSAQTATTKASEASASASTATAKATEATTAATSANTAKTDAVAAKTAAQTAQTAAETAQGAAEDAAQSVSASAAQIATNTADISDLKNTLTDTNDALDYATKVSAVPITEKDKYLGINNNHIDVNNPLASSTGYGYSITPCKAGDVFTVSGISSITQPMAWAFTDSEYVILSMASSNITVTDIRITAPQNSAYLVIHDKTPYRLSYKGAPLTEKLDFKLSKGAYTEQIPFTLIKGKYLLQDGTEASNNNFAIAEADLTGISGCLRVCSFAGSGNARYAFYDVGGNAIEIKTQSKSATKAIEDVKIPENAVKVKASGFKNFPSYLPRVSLVKYDEYLSNSNGGVFADLLVPNEFEDVAYSWSSGGFYYTNNEFVESEDAHFMSINVVEGEFYRITGNSYYSNNIYGFVNSNNVVTWFPNASNAKSYDEIVKIPNGTVAMIVQGKASETTTIKKATGYADGRIFLGKKIAVIGDSTVEKNATATMKWHDKIALETGLKVVNLGVSGTGYKRGEENSKAYYQRLSSVPSDCDAVVFFGSGNDNGQTVGTITDTTTDTVCGCVNKTLNDLVALYPTMKIGVITAYPWRSFKPSTTNAMQTIANDIVEICRGNSIPVLDLYHCSNLRPWVDENNEALFANADGVHINDAGHAIVTPMILEFLKTLLSSY